MENAGNSGCAAERLTRLVSLYQLPLLRLCFAYLHDEEMAKDAVQDTFLKAYCHLADFRNESSEQTWLYRIAINVCKDMRKSSWFRHVDKSVSPDMIPEPAAEVNEQEYGLTLQIMNLPPKMREAALLCWLQGMTYEAAAQTLGISNHAIGTRLNRARIKLRAYLDGGDPDDPA